MSTIPNSILQVPTYCIMADYTHHHWTILILYSNYLEQLLAVTIGYHHDQGSTPHEDSAQAASCSKYL